jgi:hypothetical protein
VEDCRVRLALHRPAAADNHRSPLVAAGSPTKVSRVNSSSRSFATGLAAIPSIAQGFGEARPAQKLADGARAPRRAAGLGRLRSFSAGLRQSNTTVLLP